MRCPIVHRSFLRLAIECAQPQVVYVSSKQDDAFVSAARSCTAAEGDDEGADDVAEADEDGGAVHIEKASLFSSASARRRLLEAPIETVPSYLELNERIHLLNSFVNLNKEAQARGK